MLAHAPRRGALPLDRLLRGWLTRNDQRKSATVRQELTTLRQFFLFRRRSDPKAYVPDRSWLRHCPSRFVAHILSPADVRLMLTAAEALRGPVPRAQTYRTLILILHCTGLRLGEAVRLELEDVDLETMVFHIRDSKGKTRFVPFRSDLARELRRYLRTRPSPSTNTRFLLQPDGRPYSTSSASHTLGNLFKRVGLKPRRGRLGPRPTDFRHSFAVKRLTLWYRAGVDLHAHLPWLSAYMGHKNLLGTQVYLSATPELLETASRRFADRFHQSRRGR